MRTWWLAMGLFTFWVLLAGGLDPVDLALGALLSVLTASWAARMLWQGELPRIGPREALRFIAYVPWLLLEVVKAAMQVAEIVLDPRLPVDPEIVTTHTSLRRDVSRVTLANSITLTPGTLTVDIDEEILLVHCLAPGFRRGIEECLLERRIARVFEADEGSPIRSARGKERNRR